MNMLNNTIKQTNEAQHPMICAVVLLDCKINELMYKQHQKIYYMLLILIYQLLSQHFNLHFTDTRL
jgi:hypothetical protein